jgi:glutathione S-transferase
MGEINLYQYPISPFSEKVRRVLTYKHLKWHPIDCHYVSNFSAVKDFKNVNRWYERIRDIA